MPISDPTQITGCKLWLDGNFLGAGGQGLNDGDAIGTWNDRSGNGFNFTQATASLKPIYKASQINGKGVARFDGVNDEMAGPAISNLLTNSAGTIAVVVRIRYVASDGTTSYQNGVIFADSSQFLGLHIRRNRDIYAYNWDTNEDKVTGAFDWGVAQYFIWRHGGGNLYLSKNGGSESSVASGNTGGMSGTAKLGVHSAFIAGMDAAEIVVYNKSLNSTEMADLADYFNTKWGLPDSPPAPSAPPVSGYTLWLPADGIGLNGDDVVNVWPDLSGNKRDLASNSAPPQFKTGVINGLPVVRFANAQQLLSWVALSTVISASAYTMFVVAKATSIDSDSGSPNQYNNDSFMDDVGSFFGLYMRSTGPKLFLHNTRSGGSDAAEASFATGTFKTIRARHDAGTLYVQIDTQTEQSVTSGDTLTLTNAVRVGGRTTFFLDGDIAEIIVYNTVLNSTQRDSVYQYLQNKYAGAQLTRKFPMEVESRAGLQRTYSYPIEVLGGRARVFTLPVEFNPFIAVSRAFPLPVEILQGQSRKLPVPVEWRGDKVLERKIPIPVEWKAGLERKIPIEVEWLTGSLSRKFVLQVEIRGGVSRLSWIEVEWRGDNVLRRKIPMPVATLLALSRKLPIPVEWAGQAFGITHTRTILRPQRFPLTHERTIIPDAQSFALTHTRTIRQTTGATLRHSRVILPAELIPLFSQDIHLPTGEVDKT